jgi:uncharacterized protein (TIGR02271 family)
MSELFTVPFISKNGIRGTVLTRSRLLDDEPEKSVTFETGRQAVVNCGHLHLKEDGTYYLDLNVDPRPPDGPKAAQVSQRDEPREVIVPRIEEQLVTTKRIIETGRVRVSKNVIQESQDIDESIIHEEYSIERVPVNREVTETVPSRVEGDITIIPVYEEELITTKRLILREEIHLIKKRREEHRPRTVILRKDQVTIERFPVSDSRKTDPATFT